MDWQYVAKQVKLARTRLSMTQDELAIATGKHRATIARLEGGHNISEYTLRCIADTLKVEYPLLTGMPETGHEGHLIESTARSREGAMEYLLAQAKEMADLVCSWETLATAGLTIGMLAKAIDKARRLKESVEALEAIGFTGQEPGLSGGGPGAPPPGDKAAGN